MSERSSQPSGRDTITAAVLRIVDERGLDKVSVREVASAAGVSIGAVQHHFPTKEAMLTEAYAAVIARIRDRIEAIEPGLDTREHLARVLAELLPTDRIRASEVRIHLAFAARAASTPSLAAMQRDALDEIHRGVTEAIAAANGGHASPAQCRAGAHAAIAVTDGLALHAVSAGSWLSNRQQREALDLVLDGLAHIGGTTTSGNRSDPP